MFRRMKKFILTLIVLALVVPSVSFAIQKFQRTGEIEKDKTGGYSETQRDHHARRKKQMKEKTGAGYYNGEYHSKSKNFQPDEWQFVEPSHGGSSSSKKKTRR
jgi:hypothetical protein